MKYLKEEFKEEHFKEWTKQYNWGIFSECGSGKTSLILDSYLPFAAQEGLTVLYLYNRKSLGNQLKNKYEHKYKNLKFMSYQELNKLIRNETINAYIPIEYDVLILDESHYFVMDASFSFETMYSWNYINECDSLKIFLTATPEPLKAIQKLMNRPLKTIREVDITNNNIDTILLTTDDDVIKNQEKQFIKNGFKVVEWGNDVIKVKKSQIVFKELGYKSVSIVSEYHKQAGITDKDIKQQLEHEYRNHEGKLLPNMNFDFLSCTKAIDNGISMYSNKNTLSVYCCGDIDFITLEQSRSRCRELNGSKITILIKIPTRKHVFAKINYFEDELSWLKDHKKWYKKHGKNKQPSYVYFEVNENDDSKLCINHMKLANIEFFLNEYKYIYQNFDSIISGYIDVLREKYPNKEIQVLNRSHANNIDEVLEQYINNNDSVRLTEDEMKDLRLQLKAFKLDKKNPNRIPSLKTIRDEVNKSEYYTISTKRVTENGKKVTRWCIERRNAM